MRGWKIGMLILLAQVVTRPALGQDSDPDAVLAGVEAVNAQLFLQWHETIEGFNEDVVRTRLQTHFELALRRRGIRISAEEPYTLALYVNTVAYGERIVVYAWRLAFEEMAIPSRTAETALYEALPAFEAAIDTAGSPSVPRVQLSGAVGARAGWTTTWEGTAGVGTVARSYIRGDLEARAREAALEFANALGRYSD